MKLTEIKIDEKDLQDLQTITELMYTAKTAYHNIRELHSQICNSISRSQNETIPELSLDAVLVFDKLYAALQIEQKALLSNIETTR